MPCREITELIDQLTPPYLLVGDFNAHNPLWGEHRNNTRGNKLAEIILNKNLVVLNKKAPTYHRLYDNTSSIIDLTLTTPTQAPNYNWTRLEDLHGSDHYPIVIRETTNNRTLNKKKWKIDQANWTLYQKKLKELLANTPHKTPQEAYNKIEAAIKKAAKQSIPKTCTQTKPKITVPWWNKQCQIA